MFPLRAGRLKKAPRAHFFLQKGTAFLRDFRKGGKGQGAGGSLAIASG